METSNAKSFAYSRQFLVDFLNDKWPLAPAVAVHAARVPETDSKSREALALELTREWSDELCDR